MATPQLALVLRHIHRLAAGRCSPQRTDRQLVEDFALCRDETAFAALVARHGPMVLRVCRRVLNHEQDAEDAFQATFLVLARNTGSIRKHEALAEWLHGVAYRTAMKAKRSAARRRNHEARLRAVTPEAVPGPSWDDVRAVLDEEIERLPGSYRSAFVLCILEGKSGPEAAKELGVREGTVWSRLNRARQRLQRQLTRRGIELSALLAAVSVAESGGKAAVPALLASATIRSGLLVAAGGPAAGVIPSHVATLAAGVTRAMFLTKIKFATGILLTVSLLSGGAGIITHQVMAGKPVAPQATATKSPNTTSKQIVAKRETRNPENEQAKDLLAVRSRVVDPDGKPVAGAKLYLLDFPAKTMPLQVRTTSAADGRFEFAIPKRDVRLAPHYYANPWAAVTVMAVADGYGPAIAPAVASEDGGEPTLRLAKDDVPIHGRVLDLQGKPISGVTIRVEDLSLPLAADLGPWLEALRHDRDDGYPTESKFLKNLHNSSLAQLIPAVSTDADGRFQLKGIGRERLVGIRIEGPTIETKQVRVMTRPGEMITALAFRRYLKGGTLTYYGATFDHYAAPAKPIVGVVRDKETGKPLAGVTIRSDQWAGTEGSGNGLIRTTTDQEGRYQLVGMPKGQGNAILALPAEGQPYLLAVKEVGDSQGLDPITVDFALKRGVLVKGRVTDKATGKPVPGKIEYVAFAENSYHRAVPNWTTDSYLYTHEDGSFEVVALPGRGLLGVRAWGDAYVLEVGADEIEGRDEQGFYRTYPHLVSASQYHTLAEINPPKDAESLTCNLVVDPGRTLTGKVLGPDGPPLAGARPFGLHSYIEGSWAYEALKTADFTAYGLTARESRKLMFIHEGLRLAGSRVVRGDEQGPITVKLEPWATVTGRLITADGVPRADVELVSWRGPKPDMTLGIPPQQSYRPDKDGRFRIEGLVPGMRYGMSASVGIMSVGELFRDLVLKPGETKDLGDVQARSRSAE
jgi:RNA polymerase sigma factor (sigma-70 family)